MVTITFTFTFTSTSASASTSTRTSTSAQASTRTCVQVHVQSHLHAHVQVQVQVHVHMEAHVHEYVHVHVHVHVHVQERGRCGAQCFCRLHVGFRGIFSYLLCSSIVMRSAVSGAVSVRGVRRRSLCLQSYCNAVCCVEYRVVSCGFMSVAHRLRHSWYSSQDSTGTNLQQSVPPFPAKRMRELRAAAPMPD